MNELKTENSRLVERNKPFLAVLKTLSTTHGNVNSFLSFLESIGVYVCMYASNTLLVFTSVFIICMCILFVYSAP